MVARRWTMVDRGGTMVYREGQWCIGRDSGR